MSMYICVSIYIYIYTYLCIYINMCIHIYINIYVCIQIYTHICVHVYIYTHIHIGMYTSMYMYIYIYIYTCTLVSACACVCTHSRQGQLGRQRRSQHKARRVCIRRACARCAPFFAPAECMAAQVAEFARNRDTPCAAWARSSHGTPSCCAVPAVDASLTNG